jgi:hypothetical protein
MSLFALRIVLEDALRTIRAPLAAIRRTLPQWPTATAAKQKDHKR